MAPEDSAIDASNDARATDESRETIVMAALFAREAPLYALLWWDDPDANIINVRSFIIDGHDSIPVFTSEPEARAQLAGSGHEQDLVAIAPGLLAAILQRKDHAVLNPGGPHPIRFETRVLAPFVRLPGA
jgi:hypothetical protein